MEKKKILFISHEATRTGAPIFLRNFLLWLKKNSGLSFLIMLKDGGELIPEFSSIAPTYIFNYDNKSKHLSHFLLYHPLIRKYVYRLYHSYLLNLIRKEKIGLIYSNTIANGEVLHFLSRLGCPIVTHVHELEYLINFFGDRNLNQIKKYTSHYIAVSDMVKDNLIRNHNIPYDAIQVVHDFIPHENMHVPDYESEKIRMTNMLNIPHDSFLVGACGEFHWVKSPELFIQLAAEVHKKRPSASMHYVWIGGDTDSPRYKELKHDVEILGLERFVHFIGRHTDPWRFFPGLDVFVLVSREESFSLVSLEASSFGKPVICFDKSCGIKEFIEDDCGFAVPYLDLNLMAERVIELMESPELRSRMGKCGAQKARDRYTIDASAPKLLNLIEEYMT